MPEYRIRCWDHDIDNTEPHLLSDEIPRADFSDAVAQEHLGGSNVVSGATGLRRALRKLYGNGWESDSILVERED